MLQFQVKQIILDDEITLLKPLGYNFITFYFPKLNKIVIFDPSLQTIVKSFEVHNIQDYEFSKDKKYLFTYVEDIISVYQIKDDQCFLLRELQKYDLIPIGLLQNVILCTKLDELFEYPSEIEQTNFKEIHILDFQGNSLQCDINDRFYSYQTFNNFYLLIYLDLCDYYKVMSKNKRLIKYFVSRYRINDAHQLKYSNFYLTRIFDELLMIMIKQSKNCKIIRKIQLKKLEQQFRLGLNSIFNYRLVINFLDFQQKHYVQIINLWNLNKQICMIDSFKCIVLTQNTNFLVSSEGKSLKIMKIN